MPDESRHEDQSALSPGFLDRHRAITSLIEELEAIDWYGQRIEACGDQDLSLILSHNRNEEMEHAAMLLEWLRRHDVEFDQRLRKHLFVDGPIRDAGAASPA